jgi:hypothetical protein
MLSAGANDNRGASGSRTVAASSMFSTKLQNLRYEVCIPCDSTMKPNFGIDRIFASDHSSYLLSTSSVQAQSSEDLQSLKPPATATGYEVLAHLEKRQGVVDSKATNQDGARTVLEDIDCTLGSQNPSSKLQLSIA